MEKIDMSLDDIIKLNRKVKKKSIAEKKKATAIKKPVKKAGFKTQGKIGALRSKYATKGGGVSTRKLAQSQSNFSYQTATRQRIKKAKLAAIRAKTKQRTQQAAQAQVQRQGTARQSLLAQRRGIQAQVKQLQSKAKKLQNLVEKQQQQIQTQQQFVPETRRKKKNRRFVRQPYQPTNNQNKAFQTQNQQNFAQQQQQTVQGKKKKRNRRFVRQPQYQMNNQLSTFQTQDQQQLSRRQRQKQKRQQTQQQRWPQQNQGWQQQEVNVQKSRRGRRFNRWKGNNANMSVPSGSQLTESFNRSNRPMQQSRQQMNYAGNVNERFGFAQQQLHTFQQQNRNNLYQQQSNRQRGYSGRGRRGRRGGRGGRGGQASRTVVMA